MRHGDRFESLHTGWGKRVPNGGNDSPVRPKESYIAIETGSKAPKCVLLDGRRRIGWRQDILDQPPDHIARLLHRAAGEMPRRRGRETKQDEAGEQRKIEAQVEAQH